MKPKAEVVVIGLLVELLRRGDSRYGKSFARLCAAIPICVLWPASQPLDIMAASHNATMMSRH